MPADPHRFQRLRRRVTLAATALVLVVLAGSAWAVTRVHRAVLVGNLEESLAQASADLLGGDPSQPALIGFGDDDAAFQVFVDGRLVRSSANLDGEPPIGPTPSDGAVVRTVDGLPHDSAEFLVRSQRSTGDGDLVVVHVAAALDDIDESVAALTGIFAVAVPVTTVVLGVALWVLVGRLVADAEAAARRQERFVADASHELRGPLTRVRTELEVDLAHPDRADPLATHRLVLEEALGMQRLVDDLLQLARGDEADRAADRRVVDLEELALRIAADLRAGTSVAVEVVAEPVRVRGRPEELGRALWNLGDNAVHHARTSVLLSVSLRGGQAVVAVSDDGPGIPADQQERIFDRFARLDDARGTAAGGTGLGLAIVREVVESHGGTVRVDPDHAPGARLEVVLPAVGP
jgi:signal transduction histidine kinase